MTIEEATEILFRAHISDAFYYGPGYSARKAIDNFMRNYPRGKGLHHYQSDLKELYRACLVVKQEQSRTKNYVKRS